MALPSIPSDLITNKQLKVQVRMNPIAQITMGGGLGYMWPHTFSSLNANVLGHIERLPTQLTSSETTGRSHDNNGLRAFFSNANDVFGLYLLRYNI